MPLDFDEIYDELKSLTNNFTKDNIILHTDYEEEKNDAVIILKNYYDIVEVSDGRMHEDEEMCYVIAVSSPKNRNISILERK